MENQEFMVVEESEPNELVIDNYSRTNLATTATWAQILAIIGFIGIGFIVLSGFLNFYTLNFLDNDLPSNELSRIGTTNVFSFIKVILPFFYIMTAVLIFYPTYKLYEFSKFTKSAIRNNNQKELTLAFESQKIYFKFMGILSLIFISISVLVTLGMSIFMVTMLRH